MERSSLFAQPRPQGVALQFHPLLNRESLPHWYTLDLQGKYPNYLTYGYPSSVPPSVKSA